MDRYATRILLATDGSEDAELAAKVAVDLSNKTGSELHVIYAWHSSPSVDYPGIDTTGYDSIARRHAERLLAEQMKKIEIIGGVAESHLRMGPPIDEILDLAEELRAGLVILGSRGLGPVGRLLLGSVSEGIVHHATCPVLVARGGAEAWPPRRVIIGDDFSEDARAAGELAVSIGKLYGAQGVLVRAHPEIPDQPYLPQDEQETYNRMVEDILGREELALKERAGEIEKTLGHAPEVRATAGDAAAAILATAGDKEPTLVAIGSRGLGPIGRIRLGSVSTKVLRGARSPVLVCPHPRS